MKKYIAVLLAALLLISLSACAEEKNEEPTDKHEIHTEDPERITGMIYGVFSDDYSKNLSTEFSAHGGVVTVERIAAGLTGWTGLKFRVSVVTDEENKKITVDWLDESSLYTGAMPDPQHEEFVFKDETEIRVFMLNSLCQSIMNNLGDYDVYYTLCGEDISSLGLDSITSETPFNKTESEIVYVK